MMASSLQSEWSPQINLGIGVLIPTNYIGSLNTRLSFYRKLAYLKENSKIQDIKDEMITTFGELPAEVKNLFMVTGVKIPMQKI
jgi:transcription-repair coupling factor (superfamily II helicase)